MSPLARVARVALRLLVRPVLGPPVPIAVQRRWMELVSRGLRLPTGTTVEPTVVAGRPAERVGAPGVDPSRTVLLVHGGAFITGSPLTHRPFAAHLSAAADAPVVVLDYRLAPEHPYPEPLDDVVAAVRELAATGPVALVGDSAGGSLALLAAQRLRDEGGPEPHLLALVSPVVDLTLASSAAWPGTDPLVRLEWARQGTEAFLGGADAKAVSPLFADLSGLPPLLVHVSGDERLRPEGERLAADVLAAGGSAHLLMLPGLWHDVHLQAGVVPEATTAVRQLGHWLRVRWDPRR